jgi:hypothetical protein
VSPETYERRLREHTVTVERLRQRRVRFRPEILPELIAWLHMLGSRYKRSIEAIRSEHRDDSDPWAKGSIHDLTEKIGHIGVLIGQATDNWKGIDWEESLGVVLGAQNEALSQLKTETAEG